MVSYFLIKNFLILIDKGSPVHRDNLQMLLTEALKVSDCARIVPVTEPLPIRFRRSGTSRKKFQCIITLN